MTWSIVNIDFADEWCMSFWLDAGSLASKTFTPKNPLWLFYFLYADIAVVANLFSLLEAVMKKFFLVLLRDVRGENIGSSAPSDFFSHVSLLFISILSFELVTGLLILKKLVEFGGKDFFTYCSSILDLSWLQAN